MSLNVFSSLPVFISSFSVIRVLHFSFIVSVVQKIRVEISTACSLRFNSLSRRAFVFFMKEVMSYESLTNSSVLFYILNWRSE